MTLRNAIAMTFLATLLLTPPPLGATEHKWVVSFDTILDTGSDICTQDFLYLHNLDSSSVTIDDITLHWNDADSLASSGDGYTVHGGAGSCSLVSSTSLSGGAGITIFVAAAASQCTTEFPDCSDSCTGGCGTDCRTIYTETEQGLLCECVPDFGTANVINTSRISLFVQVDDNANDAPSIRAATIKYSGCDGPTPTPVAAMAAEVTKIQ